MKNSRIYFAVIYDKASELIYVLGGYGDNYLDQCEKYDLNEDTWKQIAPMSKKKQNHSACLVSNKFIYVIGGEDGYKNLSDIEYYDVDKNQWNGF